MAYDRDSQGYPGQHPRYQAPTSQQPQPQYSYQQRQQHLVPAAGPDDAARRSSFETGDDSSYYPGGGNTGGGAGGAAASDGGAGAGNNAFVRMPNYSHFAGDSNTGNSPHAGSTGSYQYQAQHSPPAAFPTHMPYNPQQYASTQQPYANTQPHHPITQQRHGSIPQQYTSPTYAPALPTINPQAMSQQPYNPAAFQSPTSPTQPQYGFPLYEAAARRQQSLHQTNPPALPPRSSPPALPTRNPPPTLPPRPQPQFTGNFPISQASSYQGYASTTQASANGSTAFADSTYTPPRPPPPPSGLHYQNEAGPPSRGYSYEQPGPYASPSTSQHQRFPSLPTYSGSGDYATPASARSSLGSYGGVQQPTSPADAAGRHPQSRPLPAQPPDEGPDSPNSGHHDTFGYDAILQEVEAAIMAQGPPDRRGSTPKPEWPNQLQGGVDPNPLFAGQHGRNQPSSNGVSSNLPVNHGVYSSDSDAEAAAGLAALRMAEEQDAADRARRSGRSNSQTSQQQTPPGRGQRPNHGSLPPIPTEAEQSSDSDRVPVDMDTYGGGMPGNVNYNYGREYGATEAPGGPTHSHTTSAASTPYSDASADTFGTPAMDYYMPSGDAIHPFPTFGARTDTGGTGGLSEPGAEPRRTSFDDGDEVTLYDHYEGGSSAGASPTRDGSHSRSSTQDHRQRSNSRPLPQIPRRGAVQALSPEQASFGYGALGGHETSYGTSAAAIHKANSIGSYGQPPVAVGPSRSATDAEPSRRHGMQITSGSGRPGLYDSALSPENANAPRDKLGEIVLPNIPAGKRRKFVPSKLTAHDYKRCPEPWALSSVLAWLQEMTEGETYLREGLLAEGLVALFTNKVPTMNVADAENLGAQIVEEMFTTGVLQHEEEWVKFTDMPTSGVVYQLTGEGCYSPMLHGRRGTGRCYSQHCMRTLKKLDLATQSLAPQRKAEDWATFYKLKKEDVANVDKKEIERQNNLHEIITSEDLYMDQLNVLLILYRDGLRKSPQQIMSPKRVDDFIKEVYGKVEPVQKVNEDYLLPQLKYRQEEQGPWIKGFADIFREWIRKAKAAYVDYAASFPNASLRIRKEAEKNVLFRQFLDQMRENERSRRLGWDTYLKAPITRLQRYSLLLGTVYKHSVMDNEEKKKLEKAIEEIKNVTLECDARVAEMSKRAELMELASKLKLRPGMERVQLNLNHLGREIIYSGDLQRKGSNRISWVDTHAILFDHYMVLAKSVQQRDAAGGVRHEIYDVSKLPIPMDLLVLESTTDDAVLKSSLKGITTATNRANTPQDNRLGRAASNTTGTTAATGANASLSSGQPTNSSMSISSGNSSRNTTGQSAIDASNDKIMYPFRIKHLGKLETYVLYAPSASNRQDWCDMIIEAKTRHASSLYAQNAEPFRLRVLADTAFNYDSTYTAPQSVVIKGTPLDRSIEECDKSFYGTGPRAGPICRALVNCSTTFSAPHGPRMMAVGTDFGVFLSDYSNPRGWVKCAAITVNNVTQIEAVEGFSLFLVLADKSLIAYNLESVVPSGGGPASADARKAPQKLSGNRDVGFFAVGQQKERTLIFYKKKEGINSTFKVLEPVYQRGTVSSRSRFGLKKGTTDFCRDFDEFYIPSTCYCINLFDKSLAVSTERGVEVLTLDKKQPFSIPDLRATEVASIATRLKDQRPLGMFRLNDNEFLLVFASVGIYVDKHGDVSRAVVMEFVGTAKEAALYNNTYLVLVDKGGDFVEVRNAMNGRLRQVVSGRDVRLLDDDDGMQGGTIKVCMQHPERDRVQLVVEMIVNEDQKE